MQTAIMSGMNTSTTVVSFMNIENNVDRPRMAICRRASLRAQARNNLPPSRSAAPVRTIAPPSTNIAVTMMTAMLPKPEKPS